MTPYQMEQMTCHEMVRNHLAVVSEYELELLKTMADDYLSFRHAVSSFLSDHFNLICDSKCYGNRLSACCSKDGIITFFADIAINALISSELDLNRLMTALQRPHEGFKCVYLGANGCLWRLKPIVCEMFLCDDATEKHLRTMTQA